MNEQQQDRFSKAFVIAVAICAIACTIVYIVQFVLEVASRTQ